MCYGFHHIVQVGGFNYANSFATSTAIQSQESLKIGTKFHGQDLNPQSGDSYIDKL